MFTIDMSAARGLCEVCRRWTRGSLCRDCVERHAPVVARCRTCALRVPAGIANCGACLRTPPPFERARCVADYAFPWDGLIRSFKFDDRPELAPGLARALADAVTADASEIDLIAPIPLAPARLRQRGYNQAWELARRCARRLQKTAMAQVLSRPRDGEHQVALDRAARQRALRDAFIVNDAPSVAGRRVALVDDVMTTGATATHASQALLRAGAAAVHVWVFARTA